MKYDLKCMDCGTVFMISCSWDQRSLLHYCYEIKRALMAHEIDFQYEQELPLENLAQPCDGELETDYSTQRPIRHNINWIRTEDTK